MARETLEKAIQVGDRTLHIGDIVYLHPNDTSDTAYLGLVSESSFLEGHLLADDLKIGSSIQFARAEDVGLNIEPVWVPMADHSRVDREHLCYLVNADPYVSQDGQMMRSSTSSDRVNLETTYQVYVGEDEIMRGLEENNNWNLKLAEAVMDSYKS